jgi:hypothetical protein
MIYIPNFINIGSGIEEMIGGYADRIEIVYANHSTSLRRNKQTELSENSVIFMTTVFIST